jgi:hypothetical protein
MHRHIPQLRKIDKCMDYQGGPNDYAAPQGLRSSLENTSCAGDGSVRYFFRNQPDQQLNDVQKQLVKKGRKRLLLFATVTFVPQLEIRRFDLSNQQPVIDSPPRSPSHCRINGLPLTFILDIAFQSRHSSRNGYVNHR